MKIRLSEIRMEIDEDKDKLLETACEKLQIKKQHVKNWWIERQSLDARRKRDIYFVYTIVVEVADDNLPNINVKFTDKDLEIINEEKEEQIISGNTYLSYPPVVVGMGPSGLFAAWQLAKLGYKPLVLERGKNVFAREHDVAKFWQDGTLNTESNVQFGEGGAGTFSDGKLTTRIKDKRVKLILDTLIKAGAPPEIAYLAKPHLGTDKLRKIAANLRREIISCGGKVFFQSKVTGFKISEGKVGALIVNDKFELPVSMCVLAIGHSARDTYRALYENDVQMEAKPFAIGLRVEHPQHMIDYAQFGKWAGNPRLGAADYHLSYRNKELNRAAYTFCMCPGGYVIGASSEENKLTVNGMSYHGRSSGISNSAVVVAVGEKDYDYSKPLSGMEFQEKWEKKAYNLGGGDFVAPVQTVDDFIKDTVKQTSSRLMQASYKPAVKEANLRDCLPEEIGETLSEALQDFDKKIWGFASNKGILTGIETRTSAPLKISRGRDFQAVGIHGLYPIGEGAGYAGGIISAAVDGVKAAQMIVSVHSKPNKIYTQDFLQEFDLEEE